MSLNRTLSWIIAALLLVMPMLSACGNSQNTSATTQANGMPSPGKISPEDYQNAFVGKKTQHLLIDVRTPDEYGTGIIAGAINIPVDQLSQRLS